MRSLVKGAAQRTSLKSGGPNRKAQAFLRPESPRAVKRVSGQQLDNTETVFGDTVEKMPCNVLHHESSRNVRSGEMTGHSRSKRSKTGLGEREFQSRNTVLHTIWVAFSAFPVNMDISQGEWNCREFHSRD